MGRLSVLWAGATKWTKPVEPFHLFRYLDEQAFRFNERKANDRARFTAVIGQIVGRRLTYKDLIGFGNAPNGN